MSKEIAKLIGKIEYDEDTVKDRINNIKIIKLSKNDTNSLNFNNNEKEQTMKYRGISIIKNKTCNTWSARPRINGKQIYISAKTQQECYIKLKKALLNKDNHTKENTKITLEQWYNKWLLLYKENTKEETKRDYFNLMKNLESIKNKPLENISVEEIIKILNSMTAKRQKQKVYELLNMLFKKAMDNEIITKNIITRIDKPKHVKENGKALTHSQEEMFIKECKKIKYGDLYLVALYQGLRKGEILGITNEDIDFKNNTLRINKAINKHNKFDTTKNEFSERIMPLFNKTKNILLKYNNTKGRIFNISYHRIDDYTKELNKLVNFKFSMKYMRFTFITRCQEENIPEFIIQAWCGHQIGSKVTKQTYTKYNAEDNSKYINVLNNSKFYSNSTQNKK